MHGTQRRDAVKIVYGGMIHTKACGFRLRPRNSRFLLDKNFDSPLSHPNRDDDTAFGFSLP